MSKETDYNDLKRKFLKSTNRGIGNNEIEQIVENPIVDPNRCAVETLNTLHSLQNFQGRIPEIIEKRLDQSREELDALQPKLHEGVEQYYQTLHQRFSQFRNTLGFEKDVDPEVDTQPVRVVDENEIPDFINMVVEGSKKSKSILIKQEERAREARKKLGCFYRDLGRRAHYEE